MKNLAGAALLAAAVLLVFSCAQPQGTQPHLDSATRLCSAQNNRVSPPLSPQPFIIAQADLLWPVSQIGEQRQIPR